MKSSLFSILLFAILAVGCAHRPDPTSSLAPTSAFVQPPQTKVAANAEQLPPKSSALVVKSGDETTGGKENLDRLPEQVGGEKEDFDPVEEGDEKKKAGIADPLEPFNRAMYHFNDKLYFWALKPVARGYSKVIPEPARISVRNFFSNLAFPARFVSCLLQADLRCAATELGRFSVNTIWGIGGLLDPSSGKELNLLKQNVDLGQTLGVYGVGHGFYIVWPVLGPSSLRDSVTIGGNFFLYPVSYLQPWYNWLGVWTYEEVNYTSLRIGDYESLKEAAIDPYVAFRDAYIQYRLPKVKETGEKAEQLRPAGVR